MKLQSSLRIISLIFYFLIMMNGEMTSIPFFLFLIFSLVDIGSAQWISCLLAFLGLGLLLFSKRDGSKIDALLIEVIIFILLLFPLLERLTTVPLYLFNYPEFIIPFSGFIIFYLVYFLLSVIGFLKKYSKN